MGREGERYVASCLAAHEADVGKRGVVIIRVGDPPLLVLGSNGSGDGWSVLYDRESSLGFRRVVDKVAASPFRTAGETSEETGPGENCEKGETSENEDGYVEDEVFVVHMGGLEESGGVAGVTGEVGRVQGIPGGHVHPARGGLEQQKHLRALRRRRRGGRREAVAKGAHEVYE